MREKMKNDEEKKENIFKNGWGKSKRIDDDENKEKIRKK